MACCYGSALTHNLPIQIQLKTVKKRETQIYISLKWPNLPLTHCKYSFYKGSNISFPTNHISTYNSIVLMSHMFLDNSPSGYYTSDAATGANPASCLILSHPLFILSLFFFFTPLLLCRMRKIRWWQPTSGWSRWVKYFNVFWEHFDQICLNLKWCLYKCYHLV